MKKIKAAKENVSLDAMELREEDLENIVGGEMCEEMYERDEEHKTSEVYWTGGGRTCAGCGCIVRDVSIYSIKGFCCPKCGYLNM